MRLNNLQALVVVDLNDTDSAVFASGADISLIETVVVKIAGVAEFESVNVEAVGAVDAV